MRKLTRVNGREILQWTTTAVLCVSCCGCSRSSTTTQPTPDAATMTSAQAPMPPAPDLHSQNGGQLLKPPPEIQPVVLSDSMGPIASEGGTLLWSTADGIFRRTTEGTEKISSNRASLMVLRGGRIAWIMRSAPDSEGFQVWQGTLSAEGLTRASRLALGTCSPRGLDADADHVYFTALCDGIVKVPWSGGHAETIVPPNVDVYVDNVLLARSNVGLAGNTLYWSTSEGIFAASKNGPETVVKAKNVCAFTVDSDRLIWADNASGHDVVPRTTAIRMMKLGGGPTITLAERQIQVVAIMSSASHVTWRTEVGAIRRVGNDGSGLTTLSETGCWGNDLAGESNRLYFEALPKDGAGDKCRPGLYEMLIQ